MQEVNAQLEKVSTATLDKFKIKISNRLKAKLVSNLNIVTEQIIAKNKSSSNNTTIPITTEEVTPSDIKTAPKKKLFLIALKNFSFANLLNKSKSFCLRFCKSTLTLIKDITPTLLNTVFAPYILIEILNEKLPKKSVNI